jgi:hypothetical protein
LFGNNDGGRLFSRLYLCLDFLGGEIGRDPVLRVGGGELGLISVDQAINDRPPKKLASF